MYQTSTLENGLRIVTDAMPGSRTVALGVLVDAGPRDDPADRKGLAHLVEHLMFQGTSNRDALQIARTLDAAGGRAGGFTARDYTCYQATVPDDYLPYALDLFGDLLLNSIYPESSLEREKSAICRELEMVGDAPDRQAADMLKEMVWGAHPVGRPVGGTQESVAKLDREDVICFVATNYLPGRTVVSAAGNIEHEDFVAQVRDGFWRMLGDMDREEVKAPTFTPGVKVATRPLNQSYFALGFPAPPFASKDRYQVHVWSTLLGGGMSSRLFRRAREERGLVYDIGAEYQAYRDAGLVVIEGSTSPDLLPEVLRLAMDEVRALTSHGWDEDELWKARMTLRGRHLLGGEDAETRMSRLATQQLYFGRHVSAEDVLAEIDSVDANSLASFCDTYLAPTLSRPALAVVGPAEGPTAFELERLLTK